MELESGCCVNLALLSEEVSKAVAGINLLDQLSLDSAIM